MRQYSFVQNGLVRRGLFALGVGLALSLFARSMSAQQSPSDVRSGDHGLSVSPNYLSEFTRLAEDLSRRLHVQIVVDPALVVTIPPQAPDQNAPLEMCLDFLARQARNGTWRRAFLPLYWAAPAPAKLAAMVRALERIEPSRLILEEVTSQRETLLIKQEPLLDSPDQRPQPPDFRAEPVYILYDPAATDDGRMLVEHFVDLQKQQEAQDLTPAQRGQLLLQSMQATLHLDPSVLQPFLAQMGPAGMQMWQSVEPDQREEMMDQFVKSAQQGNVTTPGIDSGTVGGEGASEHGSSDYSDDLNRMVAALARRYHVTILVDPAIFLSVRPQMPDKRIPVAEAIDALTAPLSNLAWKQVYLAEAQRAVLPSARQLSIAARALERPETSWLVLEDLHAKRRVRYSKEEAISTSFLEELRANGFSSRPIYLLYSSSEAADSGLTPEQFYSNLQRQQMEMMLQMNTAQLTQVMEQGLQEWQGLNPAESGRVMSLPIFAAMMAVWLPRAAAERAGDSR